MSERFSYSGSATIAGVPVPNVVLQEDAPDGGLRSWRGLASFNVAEAPEGFPGELDTGGPVPVELHDGRTGEVLVRGIGFNGGRWTVDLLGTGPAPQ
ncbi:hypothetical protein ABZ904_08620 [Streptomyces sp. NPDC046900]|uniref:hypothetical protein n=1 Tax=Streptomyces sp. NPDC046900 TaxID=3155473 RepID=UPI0033F403E2